MHMLNLTNRPTYMITANNVLELYNYRPRWPIIDYVGRFGRGVSLYHYRSQLFVRFVGTVPTADGQFSEI